MFRRGGEVIDPDAQLYFDEAGGALTSTFRSAINWGFLDLKATGNYDKIDLAIWATGPDQTLATTNLVELSACFKSLTPEEQKAVTKLATELKQKFSK